MDVAIALAQGARPTGFPPHVSGWCGGGGSKVPDDSKKLMSEHTDLGSIRVADTERIFLLLAFYVFLKQIN